VRHGGASSSSPVGIWLLASLLIVGGVAAGLSIGAERNAAAERDDRAADVADTELFAAVQQTIGALRGADGLVVDGEMSAAEFEGFAKDVLTDSLFSTLAYSRVVRDDDLQQFEAETGLDVRDTNGSGGFVPTAHRNEHLVVSYVYPSTDATKILYGFDIASDPVRAGAAAATATSGAPALARLPSLAGTKRPGLFGIQAVHAADASIVGYISSGVNLDDVLAVATEGAGQDTDVSVYLDGALVGGGGVHGAVRMFDVAGLSFVVDANDRDDTHFLLPVLTIVGTLLLALGVLLTARRDRRLRLQRERVAEVNRGLAELGQRLAAAINVEAIVDELLGSGAQILGATAITVARRTDVEPELIVVRRRDVSEPSPSGPTVSRIDTEGSLFTSLREATVIEDAAVPALYLPLRFHSGYRVGALGLEWPASASRDLDELRSAATTAAELAARAIERAVITYTVQEGAARLSGLARSLASATTSTDVAEAVDRFVPSIVGSAYASIVTRNGNGATAGTGLDERPEPEPNPLVDRVDQVVRDGSGVEVATIELGWTTRVGRTPTLHAVLDTIAELVGLTLSRTGLYDQEHELITELQTALLPPTPTVDGLEIEVRYEPASQAVGIGGDWYDVVTADDGRCFAVIGDVSGHGAAAVTTMAQLKAVIAHLLAVHTPADDVYEHADAMLVQQGSQATAQIVQFDPDRKALTVSTSGHPDALLRRADGSVVLVAGHRRPLLGVRWHEDDRAVEGELIPFGTGDVLLMYTDGLIERRRKPIDEQIRRLAEAFGALDVGGELAPAVDRLIEIACAPTEEDTAIDDDRALIAIRRRV